MKPKYSARRPFLPTAMTLAGLALAATNAHAVIYYWDNNGTTAGFGTAAGTWAAPTTGSITQGWSQSSTGAITPVNVTTTTSDTLNFGTGANNLGFDTITVSGTVNAGNLNFQTTSASAGPSPFTLTGGTINLAATSTIFNGNNVNTIDSALSGATNLTIPGVEP